MEYKRQYRELSDETREKIKKSSLGKKLSANHRQHIAAGLRKYWETVPNRPKNNETDTNTLI